METPGGGGYGLPDRKPSLEPNEATIEKVKDLSSRFVERGSVFEFLKTQESF